MFPIIGAMAEFERSLTQERVRAGLRNARAKGGDSIPLARVEHLRAAGLVWSKVFAAVRSSEGDPAAGGAIRNFQMPGNLICFLDLFSLGTIGINSSSTALRAIVHGESFQRLITEELCRKP